MGFRARVGRSDAARTDHAQVLGILVRAFRMPTSDTIRETRGTQTSLELILVALEHIEARGSLLSFTHDHAQRVRLMKVMTEIELLAWNAMTKKYELTPFGCQCLAAHRADLHFT